MPKAKSHTCWGQDSHSIETLLDAELLKQGGTKKARNCTELHKQLIGAAKSGKSGRKNKSFRRKQDQGRRYEYDSLTGRLVPHIAQKSRSHSQQQQRQQQQQQWQQQQCAASCAASGMDIQLDGQETSGTMYA